MSRKSELELDRLVAVRVGWNGLSSWPQTAEQLWLGYWMTALLACASSFAHSLEPSGCGPCRIERFQSFPRRS